MSEKLLTSYNSWATELREAEAAYDKQWEIDRMCEDESERIREATGEKLIVAEKILGITIDAVPNQLTADAQNALLQLRVALTHMEKFVAENRDADGDEPKCGYSDWDETMADYREGISDAAESLADALSDVE